MQFQNQIILHPFFSPDNPVIMYGMLEYNIPHSFVIHFHQYLAFYSKNFRPMKSCFLSFFSVRRQGHPWMSRTSLPLHNRYLTISLFMNLYFTSRRVISIQNRLRKSAPLPRNFCRFISYVTLIINTLHTHQKTKRVVLLPITN